MHRLCGVLELRERVRPFRAESFSLNLSGGVALCGAREVAAPAAGANRKGHLRFPFLFELLPFPCFLIWRRFPICDRFEKGNDSRVTTACLSPPFRSSQTAYCYTDRKVYAGATYPCCATREHVIIDSTYEDKLCRTPKFAGAFRYSTLKNCATRVCRACGDPPICVAVRYPTLRICRDMGAHCAPLR